MDLRQKRISCRAERLAFGRNSHSRWFRGLGQNIRLYDLRHTAATLALTVGVSPKVVLERLGHTSAAFTFDVYAHVLPQMQDDAAARVEAGLMS